ncbi:MAG: S24/S26 family peptidase [Nitrospirota bacterium]
MTPTIQEGGRLELSPSTSLTVGSIVGFLIDPLLVCHRITAIDPLDTFWTRGDATQCVGKVVQPGSVIGGVTNVLRKGVHVSLGQRPHLSSAAAHRAASRAWFRLSSFGRLQEISVS